MTDGDAAGLDAAALEQQERDLVLSSFDLLDAWRLGSAAVEIALRDELPAAIDIRRGSHVLFRAMLPGTTADQQDWLRRKANVVERFESSTALVALRIAGRDLEGWLAPDEYAFGGGGFPIRVRGAGVVGAISVSGLPGTGDHDLATAGLRHHLADG